MTHSEEVRRAVLRGLGGSLLIAVARVHAQAPGSRRVAVFHWLDRKDYGNAYPRFFPTLAEKGWKEGSTLLLEWHGIRVDDPNLDVAAAKVVSTRPDAILTESTRATRAIASATRTIPIVAFVGDPVTAGFARTLVKPGANVTGACACAEQAPAQLIALLRSLAPRLSSIGIVFSSRLATAAEQAQPLLAAAAKSGIAARLMLVSPAEIEPAIRRAAQEGVQALVIGNLVDRENFRKAGDAARDHRLAAATSLTDLKDAFLLTSETKHVNMEGSLALALDKVLRGESPGQIPWVQPDGSTIVVNRRIARAIGLQVPYDLLIRANEVID